MEDINTQQVAIFMHKLNNEILPCTFKDMFFTTKSIHNYPTSNSQNVHLSNPRSLIAHRSIRHLGHDVWNSLSDSLKSYKALYSFKANMKRQLLSQYNTLP